MLYSFEQIVGVFAGVFGFVAFILYYISIYHGGTRPNRATWFILTVVGVLIAVSYYASGARETIWVSISYVIGPLIAFVLSLKYGEGGWTLFDQICLIGCLISVVAWVVTDSPQMVLFFNVLIDFLGILPTIKKSYTNPLSEDRTAWLVTSFSSFSNIFAVKSWTFIIGFYPVYMLLVNSFITMLLFLKRNNDTIKKQSDVVLV